MNFQFLWRGIVADAEMRSPAKALRAMQPATALRALS